MKNDDIGLVILIIIILIIITVVFGIAIYFVNLHFKDVLENLHFFKDVPENLHLEKNVDDRLVEINERFGYMCKDWCEYNKILYEKHNLGNCTCYRERIQRLNMTNTLIKQSFAFELFNMTYAE